MNEQEKIYIFLKNVIKDIRSDIVFNDSEVYLSNINSLDFIKLIILIEEKYFIEFEDSDLNIKNYIKLSDFITIINKYIKDNNI